jgi:hypothetical protein
MAEPDRPRSPFVGMADLSARTPVRVLPPGEIERLLVEHRLYLETEYHEGHRANFSSADLGFREMPDAETRPRPLQPQWQAAAIRRGRIPPLARNKGLPAQHQVQPAASRPEVGKDCYFFWGGTGMPGIFTLTAPRWLRLVK